MFPVKVPWSKLGPYLRKKRGGKKEEKKETLVDLVGFKIYRSKIKNVARHWWSEGWNPPGDIQTHIYVLTGGLSWQRDFVPQGLVLSPCWLKRDPYPVALTWHLAETTLWLYRILFLAPCCQFLEHLNKTKHTNHTKTKLHTTLFLISCINLEVVRYKNGHTKRQMTWNIITKSQSKGTHMWAHMLKQWHLSFNYFLSLAFLIHTIFPLRVKAWNILKDSCKMIWSRWSQRKKNLPKT